MSTSLETSSGSALKYKPRACRHQSVMMWIEGSRRFSVCCAAYCGLGSSKHPQLGATRPGKTAAPAHGTPSARLLVPSRKSEHLGSASIPVCVRDPVPSRTSTHAEVRGQLLQQDRFHRRPAKWGGALTALPPAAPTLRRRLHTRLAGYQRHRWRAAGGRGNSVAHGRTAW